MNQEISYWIIHCCKTDCGSGCVGSCFVSGRRGILGFLWEVAQMRRLSRGMLRKTNPDIWRWKKRNDLKGFQVQTRQWNLVTLKVLRRKVAPGCQRFCHGIQQRSCEPAKLMHQSRRPSNEGLQFDCKLETAVIIMIIVIGIQFHWCSHTFVWSTRGASIFCTKSILVPWDP